MNKKKAMSAQEVATFLHVTKPTVYNWVKAGLKGTIEKKIGVKRRMVFTEQDLLDFFQVEKLDELLSKRME